MQNANAPRPDFEQLVELHSRELFVYLWRLLQHDQDAEDCLQDTFLRAFRALDSLQHTDNLRAWLYKIATNVARTHLKKNSRAASTSLEIAEDLPSPSPGPEAATLNRMDLHHLSSLVLALPAKQRAALILHRYQELPYPEVARILDITEDAARANVYQAARKLRAQTGQKEYANA